MDCKTPVKPTLTTRKTKPLQPILPKVQQKTPFQVTNIPVRTWQSEFRPSAAGRCRTVNNDKNNNNSNKNGLVSHNLADRLGSFLKKQSIPNKTAPNNISIPKTPGQSHKQTDLQVIKKTPGHITGLTQVTKLDFINLTAKTPGANLVKTHGNLFTKTPGTVASKTPSTTRFDKSSQSPIKSVPVRLVRVEGRKYQILRSIGEGGSADVYEAYDISDSHLVAIKIVNLAKFDQKSQESYLNEVNLLEKLKNAQHVVRMIHHEHKLDCNKLYIVMERGEADLDRLFRRNNKLMNENQIDVKFIEYYWPRILMAVNEIHRMGIVHADIKPVNFLLVNSQIKLIDFGIAGSVDLNETSIVKDFRIGSINYMAPETLKDRANDPSYLLALSELKTPGGGKKSYKYNSKADIWSLGCILYEFVYGEPPFKKYKEVESIRSAIEDPTHQIDFPDINYRDKYYLLDSMKSCLRYMPADRPTAEELLNHPYIGVGLATRNKR